MHYDSEFGDDCVIFKPIEKQKKLLSSEHTSAFNVRTHTQEKDTERQPIDSHNWII